MKKTRKYLLRPAKILIAIWVLSTILTKCGGITIRYDVINATNKIPTVLKKEASKSREYLPFPEYFQSLVEKIENDTTNPNLQHFFFNLSKTQVFLTIIYDKEDGTIHIDAMSDNFIPLKRIVSFDESRVSAVTILKALDEFKTNVLDANSIEYHAVRLNYFAIFMAFFDDYQYYILLIIILLLSLYINYSDAVKYEQYTKMNADEET